MLKNSGKHAIN